MPRYTGPAAFFRSVVDNDPCRHRHARYLEAVACGDRRSKKVYSVSGFGHVVDEVGAPVSHERGMAHDEAAHDAALEARQAARREETEKLRQEVHEADRKKWWDPNRPR